MSHTAIYLIEGGKPLTLIKEYFSEIERVNNHNAAVAKELGVDNAYYSRLTGEITGVIFPKGKSHPEFKAPSKKTGVSYPKKGSEWEKRLQNAGNKFTDAYIANELKIPCHISYKLENGNGSKCIGIPFSACGFLFTSIKDDGVFALYVPDVEKYLEEGYSNEGYVETTPKRDFKLKIDGCKRILDEEWELIVAKDNARKKGIQV